MEQIVGYDSPVDTPTPRVSIPFPVFVTLTGIITSISMLLAIPAGGIASLCILAKLVEKRPIVSMTIWGAVYVPLSALWVFPAFDGAQEYLLGGLGLMTAGGVFYGGASLIGWVLFRRIPILILPIALAAAELTASSLGLVLAPIGLFAVDNALGFLLAIGTVYGASAFLGFGAALIARYSQHSFALTFGMVFLIGMVPGPSRPAYDGPEIFGISHSPDSSLKWSSKAYAAETLERLKALSAEGAGRGLTVWPENAVTGTFNLEDAVAGLDPAQFPILFGMTRFVQSGSPELRNSVVLVTSAGVQVSDKEILVPLIEAGNPFIGHSDLGEGTRHVLTLDDGTTILPLICYEAAFLLDFGKASTKPDVIIVIAAESGFKRDWATSIMLRHARARELEVGVRTVRVSDESE